RPAQPLERPEPAYPEAARRMGIEGDVVLDLSIDAAGRVVDARVARGAPPLAAAALDAAKRWRYRPALVDGRPSPARARATISFRLAR
ncbi:MAG: energy transducer TonB, partial [Candidatus Polarisedimenticolia bacterium]